MSDRVDLKSMIQMYRDIEWSFFLSLALSDMAISFKQPYG